MLLLCRVILRINLSLENHEQSSLPVMMFLDLAGRCRTSIATELEAVFAATAWHVRWGNAKLKKAVCTQMCTPSILHC